MSEQKLIGIGEEEEEQQQQQQRRRQQQHQLKTPARKFSNTDFFSENSTIER